MKLKDILEATTVAGINMGKPGLGGTDWWRFQIEGGTKDGETMYSAFVEPFDVSGYRALEPEDIPDGFVEPETHYQKGFHPDLDYRDDWTGPEQADKYPTYAVRDGKIGAAAKKGDSWVGNNGADDFPNE